MNSRRMSNVTSCTCGDMPITRPGTYATAQPVSRISATTSTGPGDRRASGAHTSASYQGSEYGAANE